MLCALPVPIDRYLTQLHRYFAEGSLRVLVGAGVSKAAGFPGWDELNRGLLERSFRHYRLGGGKPALLADRICTALGREAAADFVWSNQELVGGGDFFKMFAGALYRDRAIGELPLPPVALQLAAMAPRSRTYTTNYDPLLELALLRLHQPDAAAEDGGWRKFREGPRGDGTGLVRHVHGWVDPDGHWGGTFVLTESQYIELQNAPTAQPNRDVAEILDGEGAVLIVGMSLADPNLRRLLYRRSLSPFAVAPTYAVIKAEDEEADLFQDAHWRARKIALIYIREHALLFPALRDIQFGTAATGQRPPWLDKAGEWLTGEGEDPFSDSWQARAAESLLRLREQITRKVAARGEAVDLSLFRLAAASAEIVKIADTKSGRPRTGREAKLHAGTRRLSVRVGREQGAAGVAFANGLRAEAGTEQALNLRFDRKMRGSWQMDFRSLISVPLFGGGPDHWLPVGVVVATSSRPAPFWKDARGNERQGILRLMVETGERLLRRAPTA
jgi:hypothetical protein